MATPTALPPLPFNPSRVRSYLVRLPLFTRLVLLVILVFWLLEFQSVWSVVQWGSLIPDECNLGTSRSSPDPWRRGSHPAIQGIQLMFLKSSVPIEHLSSDPHRILPRSSEYCGSYTALGAIRSGTWHPYCGRPIPWTWVALRDISRRYAS